MNETVEESSFVVNETVEESNSVVNETVEVVVLNKVKYNNFRKLMKTSLFEKLLKKKVVLLKL